MNVTYFIVGVVIEQYISLKSRFRFVGGNSCGSYGVCRLDVSVAVVDTDNGYTVICHPHSDDLLE